jgi:hypothetical protein
MMRFTLLFLLAFLVPSTVFAESDARSAAPYPEGWRDWPVHHTGRIPPRGSAFEDGLPEVFLGTYLSYEWVNEGRGARTVIRVNGAKLGVNRWDLADGPTAVLELPELGVLFVTHHEAGKPVYGAYTVDGQDLAGAHPTLAPKYCRTCHASYAWLCMNGVCNDGWR